MIVFATSHWLTERKAVLDSVELEINRLLGDTSTGTVTADFVVGGSLFPGRVQTVGLKAETINQACDALRDLLLRAYGVEWTCDRAMKAPVEISVRIDRRPECA